ncbi:hypothetical protein Pcinc_017174 [Petrolisthes cinctipes]|uniref:Uncharacterized protein n=1 Tax=Petrolisthes cinctipes TaxID=88211 RepID=A0AAE1FUP9_PETCI|nr:hypothetical protein Pcinc_017174 [Petrolisthes cinctipes]
MANSSPDNSTNDTSRPSSLPTPTTTMSDLILGLVAVEAACQSEAKTGKGNTLLLRDLGIASSLGNRGPSKKPLQ